MLSQKGGGFPSFFIVSLSCLDREKRARLKVSNYYDIFQEFHYSRTCYKYIHLTRALNDQA